MAEEYIRWQHAETGQWYVTQTDHSKPCPIWITRPIYPDIPVGYRRVAEPEEEQAPVAEPVARPADIDEPWVPQAVRTAARRAAAHGWQIDLTKATSPRGVYTLGLRCDRGRRRVAMTWRWRSGRWSSDGCWSMPPITPIGAREALALLEQGDTP